jgi:hypothetical protein
MASICAIFVVVLGQDSADAQRRAAPRSPAPQGHHAVPRPIPARPLPGGHYYYRGPNVYRPYYASPYYWYGGFYGGYYSYPFYFSVGVGPYAPYYYGYPHYPWYPYDPAASLRLQVTPREAEAFIDGFYAGTVDDFDGTFQRLRLYPGEHTIEVFLPGHRILTQRIYLQVGKTFTVRAALQPLAPGEPEPVRPSDGAGAHSRTPAARPSGSTEENDDVEWPPQLGPRTPFGILALRVQPGDAAVTIDGDVWDGSDETGPLMVHLAAGAHAIGIRKQGYRTYITELTVRPGETTTLNVAMTPDR